MLCSMEPISSFQLVIATVSIQKYINVVICQIFPNSSYLHIKVFFFSTFLLGEHLQPDKLTVNEFLLFVLEVLISVMTP